jgi:hypothetical protein
MQNCDMSFARKNPCVLVKRCMHVRCAKVVLSPSQCMEPGGYFSSPDSFLVHPEGS